MPALDVIDPDAAAVRALLHSLAHRRRQCQLSRAEVARRMRTTRAVVTRVEESAGAGGGLQMATVARYARAVGARLGLMAVLPSGVMLFGVEHGQGEPCPEPGVAGCGEFDADAAGE